MELILYQTTYIFNLVWLFVLEIVYLWDLSAKPVKRGALVALVFLAIALVVIHHYCILPNRQHVVLIVYKDFIHL
jgi:hypothetical protein